MSTVYKGEFVDDERHGFGMMQVMLLNVHLHLRHDDVPTLVRF